MKSEEIKALFSQFENASVEIEGIECWSARELQKLLGYTQWRRFSETIDRAKESCQNVGELVAYHFADVGKMVPVGCPFEAEKMDNNSAVRRMLLGGGIIIENLAPAEDIKKLERKMKSEEKKALKKKKKSYAQSKNILSRYW